MVTLTGGKNFLKPLFTTIIKIQEVTMAQEETRKLDSGNAFPELPLRLVDGSTLTLPGGLNGKWGVLLVYRGHW